MLSFGNANVGDLYVSQFFYTQIKGFHGFIQKSGGQR